MNKLLNLFGIGWIKWIAIIGAFVAYTLLIYNQGKNSEKIDTLELENKYKQEVIDLTTLQFNLLNENIQILNEASNNFEKSKSKTNTIVREINNHTVQEIEKPVYKDCKVSPEYFEQINQSIKQLNGE